MTMETGHHGPPASAERRASLVDILDRVLATGVVVTGDVTLSIAGVDLVHISLRTLVQSVRANGVPQRDSMVDRRAGP